jgi:hypothetical protein
MYMFEKIKEFNSVQFLLLLSVVFPILTYAYDPLTGANDAPSKVIVTPSSFKDLIMIVVNLITAVLPVIILLALIYFLWGLTQYLKNAGENKEEAKSMMLSGIIGFFVMASVWGFIGILSGTLGIGTKIPSDLGTANKYLKGEGVSDDLKMQQDELLKGLDYDLENSYEDFSIPGYSKSNKKTNGVVVEQTGEGKNSKIPSWFSSLMPWNWFKK